MALDRILIDDPDGRRIPVEPAEIYYVEADDHDTKIRLRGKRLLRDGRGLGQVLAPTAGVQALAAEVVPRLRSRISSGYNL